MELLTRWDQFPLFKSILFFIFFKGGEKTLQQINRTINFLIYLLQRVKKKKTKSQCEVTEPPGQTGGKHSTCKFPSEITPQAVGYLEIDIFNFLTA